MPETPQEYTQRILGHVQGQDALKVQRSTAAKLNKLMHGLTPKQFKWKPAPEKWSIAEIMAHLADVEIVASWRMRSILGSNGTTIQAFDQDAWASVFAYNQRDPKHSIETFRVLRENNLAMLAALSPEAWENFGMHQERGKESISHLARMFAGHDTNHMRQIELIVAEFKKASPRQQKRSKTKSSQTKAKTRKRK